MIFASWVRSTSNERTLLITARRARPGRSPFRIPPGASTIRSRDRTVTSRIAARSTLKRLNGTRTSSVVLVMTTAGRVRPCPAMRWKFTALTPRRPTRTSAMTTATIDSLMAEAARAIVPTASTARVIDKPR